MKLVLAFDNDEAGQAATKRAIGLAEQVDKWWEAIIKFDLIEFFDQRSDNRLSGWWDNAPQMEEENKKDFHKILFTWKKELVGDKSFIRLCTEKINELEDNNIDIRIKLDECLRNKIQMGDEWDESLQWFVTHWQEELDKSRKEIRKWKILKDVCRGKLKVRDFTANIERAKQVPIPEILGVQPKLRMGRLFIKCPLGHTDKTASMCWYQKNNKAKCYSCQFNGDPIDLFRKLYSCDFKTAVESLNKF